jgi:hypothetical protein
MPTFDNSSPPVKSPEVAFEPCPGCGLPANECPGTCSAYDDYPDDDGPEPEWEEWSREIR